MLGEVDRDALQRQVEAIVAAFEPLCRSAQAGPECGRQAEILDGDFSVRERDGRGLRQDHRVLVTKIDFE